MQGNEKIKAHDYSAQPNGGSNGRNVGYDHTYLGIQPSQRDQSIDGQGGEEGYDLNAMQRSDSNTPLHPPEHNAYDNHSPYIHAPQPAASHSTGRVHYPTQTFTSVPLRDETTSPSPQVSGRNTPNGSGNKKKHWSFLPMHSQTSLENGQSPTHGEKHKRPRAARSGSWDLLGDRAEWEGYNPKNASVDNLRFAEGDVGTNKASRLYYWLLNRGIVVRWAMYILPVAGMFWIPGILGVTAFPHAKIWDVKLLWWSIWLSVLWGGFWAATAVFLILPYLWRNIIGSIVPGAKAYTDVVSALGRYAKLIVWNVAIWVSFTPLIINHYTGPPTENGITPRSRSALSVFVNILFGLFLCAIVLAGEKLIIQLIAFQFHRDSYEDRLKEQKFNVKCLTAMYINSSDIPGRTDTLRDNDSSRTKASQLPKVAIRKALRGLREAAQTTTTALGNVASEMAGQSVLQTNSPSNKVTAALTSANKSKALARRLFYSFRKPGAAHLTLEDIARFFPDLETAEIAFAMFDQDNNGDASRDEIESAVLQMHRERLSLEASMRDLDGAVRRLDDIFMVIVLVIVILILAAMVTTKLTTLVTSAGTFVLGLSWLIGSTMQEILLSCIFLFVKHPYDVGDRIQITGDVNIYTVAKMQLLSTNFKREDGKFVWMGHNMLALKMIENIRRSGPTYETFTFEVAFDTGFEALQALRAKMLVFCKDNARDFLPVFDVVVDDIPAQGKMVLKADIHYKSNWQQVALKIMRRNKWICALKMALADLKIFGPDGAGDPAPAEADPTRYTLVPWEEVKPAAAAKPDSPPPTFASATATAALLTDKRLVINDPSQDLWDENLMDDPTSGYGSRPGTPGASSGFMTPSSAVQVGPPVGHLRNRMPHGVPGEQIEMTSAPVARRL